MNVWAGEVQLCISPGLAHLSAMTELETLWLYNQRFEPAKEMTPAGLTQLKSLKKLRALNLRGTEYTDEGLNFLASLSELRELKLWCNGITDVTLAHLEGMPKLEKLAIMNGEITDAGLPHLSKLKKLKLLTLWSTRVTTTGFQNLKTALPSLEFSLLSGSRPPVDPKPSADDPKNPGEGAPPAPSGSPFDL